MKHLFETENCHCETTKNLSQSQKVFFRAPSLKEYLIAKCIFKTIFQYHFEAYHYHKHFMG